MKQFFLHKITYTALLLSLWVCCCCFMCSPLPNCVHGVSVSKPEGADSMQVTMICDGDVIQPTSWTDERCPNNTCNTDFAIYTSDETIWKDRDRMDCKLTIDVFCGTEKYPFTEYEWTINRHSEKDYWFENRDDAKTLPIMNDVCGIQKPYALHTADEGSCKEQHPTFDI